MRKQRQHMWQISRHFKQNLLSHLVIIQPFIEHALYDHIGITDYSDHMASIDHGRKGQTKPVEQA
ncbi:MAG: hypothetical protein R6W74_11475, partial [Nitrosomonas halophila]